MDNKKKASRSSTPRSRTGCLTCRKRRVKCDENRPACSRCSQAGWKCDGFPGLPADATSLGVPTESWTPKLAITRYSIPFQVPGSQKDRQLLHYFCVKGSHELAGFLELDFWTRTVFEQSHRDSTVRQALVSVSSLHLDYTSDLKQGSRRARDETLEQYGKALRMLQRRMRRADDEAARAALVCSVLFYCFETTAGNSEGATHHLHGGMKMLSWWRQQHGDQDDGLDGISLEFERLSLQATLFYDQPIPYRLFPHGLDEGEDEGEELACTTGPFKGTKDAYRALVKMISCGWRLICDNVEYKFSSAEEVPRATLARKRRLAGMLEQWKESFDLVQKHDSEGERREYGHGILLVLWNVGSMLIGAVFPADASVWGATPNERAGQVLRLIEEVVGEKEEIVSSEMGVIAPLFALALKCADPEVSGRAYELLGSMQRREGLWEASHMASLVSQLRDAREARYGRLGEGALAAARSRSLEDVFHDEIQTAEWRHHTDTGSTHLEKVVKAMYARSGVWAW